jgi:UDPglucose--hexose-1-phosphate uridylyltransferase
MPEYRHDPLTGRMVIVAEERASRPYQFDIEANNTSGDPNYRPYCPFCEGNESLTPGEISAFRNDDSPPDSPGWTVRTIPNLYPAVVRSGSEPAFEWNTSQPTSMFGFGAHEVIVDTPRHVLSIADMTETEVEAMFRMYAVRLRSLRSENRFASVMIFKNVGQAAGASLPHSHSQLIALPFIPESLRSELDRAKEYAAKEGTPCLWCDRLENELNDGCRIIEKTERFVALCPFVSRFPAEVAVYPRRHEPFFEDQTEVELAECARLLRRTILRLEKSTPWIKGRLAYNIILHTGPLHREPEMPYHFHFAILPSLSRAAGFEWGTGLHINPVSPETAAARLREEGISE